MDTPELGSSRWYREAVRDTKGVFHGAPQSVNRGRPFAGQDNYGGVNVRRKGFTFMRAPRNTPERML